MEQKVETDSERRSPRSWRQWQVTDTASGNREGKVIFEGTFGFFYSPLSLVCGQCIFSSHQRFNSDNRTTDNEPLTGPKLFFPPNHIAAPR